MTSADTSPADAALQDLDGRLVTRVAEIVREELMERRRQLAVISPETAELADHLLDYLEGGKLLRHPALTAIARARGLSPAQVALAWVLSRPGVMAIPKAGTRAHLLENIAALDVGLTDEELEALDTAFPPPKRKRPLAML